MSAGLLRSITLLLSLAGAAGASGALPSPESHFGHEMGADKRLIEWDDVVRYFRRVADASGHVDFSELGKSTEGRPFVMVTIAAPETLKNLRRYRRIQSSLADPRQTTPGEAEALIAEGKAVVLITCSIHSTEVASTLAAVEFVHKLLTEVTPRHQAILRDTIFLLIPSLNPDGVDKVARWYKRYLGTPYEGAPMTELYHKYVGHDNNRDWYSFSQAETRLTVEKVHNVWWPQITYDVHQMGGTGARMFVPPWADPVDPNIDPLIVQQVNKMGTAMAVDLTTAGKKGVLINGIYDYFTPARHYPSYHGGLRLLSEAASVRYASPVNVPFSSLKSNGRGYNAQQASWNFLEPWAGGRWTLCDIIDYQLITFESCLYNAALQREDLLRNFYRIGRRVIKRHKDLAYVIPRQQHDPSAMMRLLRTLAFGAVEIEHATDGFRAGGRVFQSGDYVIRLAQPYGAFAKTLLEKQNYPDLRQYPGGPPQRPYDVTAHNLPLLMGVEVVPINEPFEAALKTLTSLDPQPGSVAGAPLLRLSPNATRAWTAVNRLLNEGVPVDRGEDGAFYVHVEPGGPGQGGTGRSLVETLAREFGLVFTEASAGLAEPGSANARSDLPGSRRRLRTPRVGLYRGHVPIMDEGWTRWVLEHYEFPYESVGNERLRQGGLRRDFDVILLPDAAPRTLHAGYLAGALYEGVQAPPEFAGGIEDEGAEALRQFILTGGTVLAFNRASQYALERLKAPARNVLMGLSNSQFYSPGSLLTVQANTSHPLCFGLRPRETVWFESGPAFEASVGAAEASATEVLRYPRQNPLASGWLLGEQHLSNRAAVLDVSMGRGHLVLFGIRPQYRAQSNATFKMVFNGLYCWEP